ncbi:MFS transporter [Silvanigrella aquatica]|uniref:Major facilitator superfamily (MFS) profile domain-containing protein n=1 Tax=Silvanigrella aquatica TaxID=1915309 RepID=A0A1L4CZ46_9BACT|nr:MFS transporter [Silvanigrella aquatica]APJ03218.1 hypothetical protein AXG55_04590 [Silvanigrella aquatica]
MINNKYFPFSLLLLAEAFERFAYFFVSFILIFFISATVENGGLGFTHEVTIKIGTYFSFGILFLPLLVAPFIDKKIGYFNGAFWGGISLILCYFLAFISTYFLSWIIFVSLILCVIGSALLKPSVSVLVGRLTQFSSHSQDMGYILFIIIVNVASLSSAYASAKFVNAWGSFKPVFILSMIFMLFYSFIIFYLNKNFPLKETTVEKNNSFHESKKFIPMLLILSLMIGISTTISSKIFSFPDSLLFWSAFVIGMVGLFYFWKKSFLFIKKRYTILTCISFIIFMIMNLFLKNFGSMSSFLPGIFSSLDMLINFFIFPLLLSFLSRSVPLSGQATFQALAFFFFSISSIMTNNYLPYLGLSSKGNLGLLSCSLVLIVSLTFVLFMKWQNNTLKNT